MGAAEARTSLYQNYKKLYIVPIVPKTDQVWRTTTAGTNWVMLSWGYREGLVYYNLHVHGNKDHGKDTGKPNMSEPKIRSSDLTQEIYIPSTEFTMMWATIKDVIANRKFS